LNHGVRDCKCDLKRWETAKHAKREGGPLKTLITLTFKSGGKRESAVHTDGKVLIGGGFTHVNGVERKGIARLLGGEAPTAPRLINAAYSAGTFSVQVATLAGHSYALEYRTALTDTTWTALPSVAGTGSVVTLHDSTATVEGRFYRVRVE
jgi:hypothetical protein